MKSRFRPLRRAGATVVFFAVTLVVPVFAVAIAVDIGYVANVRTELQATADATALAGASQLGLGQKAVEDEVIAFGNANTAGGGTVNMNNQDVEIGIWDRGLRKFTPDSSNDPKGNAVRVTTKHGSSHGDGEGRMFFGRMFSSGFDSESKAVASPEYAYAVLTSDVGVLADPSIPNRYRIRSHYSESRRQTRAYRWLIEVSRHASN